MGEKTGRKGERLFKKQLKLFVLSINQVSNIIKKGEYDGTIGAMDNALKERIDTMLPLLNER
jgi:hypothetical protein